MKISTIESFLETCATSYHVAQSIQAELTKNGFNEITFETEILKPSSRYYIMRKGQVFAFITPDSTVKSSTSLLSHTDSPAYKIRPKTSSSNNCTYFEVEPYGGPHAVTYFSRILNIAGRVTENTTFRKELIHDKSTAFILPIPSIHLLKENKGVFNFSAEKHLSPLMSYGTASIEKYLQSLSSIKDIASYELFLVPECKPTRVGVDSALLGGYGLDNRVSVYAALKALINATPQKNTLLASIFFDHEELGSGSQTGAKSNMSEIFYKHILEKLDTVSYASFVTNSIAYSLDNAHACHVNEESLTDSIHKAILNDGVCIKKDANRRYASSSDLEANVQEIAKANNIPLQYYIPNKKNPGGSTLGPLFETATGISTLDLGIPQLSMHSSLEVCGIHDINSLEKLTMRLIQRSSYPKEFTP